jgi:hypothetical protein
MQRDGGDPWQWFFLAMAEWQLGNHDAARDWYAKAIDWMEKHPQIVGGETHRFRTEAAKLLGRPSPARLKQQSTKSRIGDAPLTPDR